MQYEVLNSIWFGKIGIVEVKTLFNGIKYYIGKGNGLNQEDDEQHIAKLGMPVSKSSMIHFFTKTEKSK
jgi:hypothetical protein